MKTTKRCYWLVLHARPNESVSIQVKHAHFFASTVSLPEPWDIGNREVPGVKIGHGTIVINLAKFFGKVAHRAMLKYSHRRGPTDDGLDDDMITITFDPAKVDLNRLVYEVIPSYIEGFGAYLVELFDDQMIHAAAEELRGLPVNPRKHVHRIGPVSFFDDLLCRRALGLTAVDLAERLEGKIECVRLMHNGVYLVGLSRVLSFEDIQRLCDEMKTLATPSA